MGCGSLIVFTVVMIMAMNGCSVYGRSIAEECSTELQKEMPCLNYATGKGDVPAKECCSAVKDLKDRDPKCLCYMMQQTHNGSEQIKSLGIQEARLLQLPSACQLENASISFCPKLLGISPNSPDAAIFANTTSSRAGATIGTSAAPKKSDDDDSSNGTKHRPYFAGAPWAIAVAITTYIFTAGCT